MLTRTELSEWIRNREDSGIEFNRQTIDKAALAKKIVAFANLQGGCILLGVDDDGSITGITREYLEAWVMTACRDKIRPEIIPYYEVLHDVEPGKHVAVVRVDRGLTVHHDGMPIIARTVFVWAAKAAKPAPRNCTDNCRFIAIWEKSESISTSSRNGRCGLSW